MWSERRIKEEDQHFLRHPLFHIPNILNALQLLFSTIVYKCLLHIYNHVLVIVMITLSGQVAYVLYIFSAEREM